MSDLTVSGATSKELETAVTESYSEGDVVPVLMDGVVIGTATVVAGGRLSVTLNDNDVSQRVIPHNWGGYSMSFEDSPEEVTGYYPEELCSKCDLPAGHIRACE